MASCRVIGPLFLTETWVWQERWCFGRPSLDELWRRSSENGKSLLSKRFSFLLNSSTPAKWIIRFCGMCHILSIAYDGYRVDYMYTAKKNLISYDMKFKPTNVFRTPSTQYYKYLPSGTSNIYNCSPLSMLVDFCQIDLWPPSQPRKTGSDKITPHYRIWLFYIVC